MGKWKDPKSTYDQYEERKRNANPEIYGEWDKKQEYDFIFIGAGHNELVTANYLARAGMKCLVFEQYYLVGGGCMSEQLTLPGFYHNTHSCMHGWLYFSPVLKDLGLEKYGLNYRVPDIGFAAVVDGGERCFMMYKDLDRTCESIAKISPKDAKTYRETYEIFKSALDIVTSTWYLPPVPYSTMWAPLEESEEGMRVTKILLQSCRDVMDEYFESEAIKAGMMCMACQGANPQDEKGTGMQFHLMCSAIHEHPWSTHEGGVRGLGIALSNALAAHGGAVLSLHPVEKIIIENKTAVGVQLKNGETVRAKRGVISGAGAPQTLLELIDEGNIEEKWLDKARKFAWDANALATPHLALNKPIRWKASKWDPDIDRSAWVAWGYDDLDEFQTQYDDIYEKHLQRQFGGMALLPCNIPGAKQAPEGQHTGAFWQFTGYEIEGGAKGWDENREDIMEAMLKQWRAYGALNLDEDNILGKYLYTPWDTERNIISMRKASMMLGDTSLFQLFAYRPWPGMAQYKVVGIEGLYLNGGSTHPFGAVTAAPGYNCARRVADDNKIKKWWED